MRARRLLYGLAAGLVSLAVALVLAEIVVRLVVPEEVFRPLSNVYARSEIDGVDYTLRRDFDGFAFGSSVQTNALGFRGPNWDSEPREGETRILLVGDSHAFGWGVEYEDSVGEGLVRALAPTLGAVEVVNLGIPGYNASQQRDVFLNVGLGLAPDAVVLIPCNNDDDLPPWVDDDGWIRNGGAPSSAPPNLVGPVVQLPGWLGESRFLLYARLVASRLAKPPPPEPTVPAHWMSPAAPGEVPEELRERVGEPLREILRASSERNLPVVLAPFAGPDEWRRLFSNAAAEANIPLVELLALFPEVSTWEGLLEVYGLGWDPHLGAEAHRRWATAIGAALEPRLNDSATAGARD